VVAAVAMIIGTLPAGCAAPDPGRTGGISLRYERRNEPVGVAVWTVETDGTIRYAGGRDVVLGRTTWTGTLDAEDIRRLDEAVALIAEAPDGDGEGDAGEGGQEPGVRTVLNLRTPDGRRRIVAEGDPVALAPLLQVLRDRARVRLDPVLDRLPRATEPPEASAP